MKERFILVLSPPEPTTTTFFLRGPAAKAARRPAPRSGKTAAPATAEQVLLALPVFGRATE